MNNARTEQIHVKLNEAESISDYVTVKDFHGMKSNSDLIRFLLRKEARAIRESRRLFPSPPCPVQDTPLQPG